MMSCYYLVFISLLPDLWSLFPLTRILDGDDEDEMKT